MFIKAQVSLAIQVPPKVWIAALILLGKIILNSQEVGQHVS